MKKDNGSLRLKAALRRNALKELADPVILEAYGGKGRIYWHCYQSIERGVVLEKDSVKVAILAEQRPRWAVYQCDSVGALAAGIGRHLPVNFVDLDPYGEPWPAVDALFASERPWPDKLVMVVTDGLRQKLKMNGGWAVGSMARFVRKYGNAAMYDNYLEICQERLSEAAAKQGYSLRRWTGYYCGYLDQMTHYAAVMQRATSPLDIPGGAVPTSGSPS